MMDEFLEGLHALVAAKHDLPPKPRWGQPCNGCGLCCILEQCPISLATFGPELICPALTMRPGSSGCGLVETPGAFFNDDMADELGAFIALILGVGTGCDASHTEEDERIADAEEAAGGHPVVNANMARVQEMAKRLIPQLATSRRG